MSSERGPEPPIPAYAGPPPYLFVAYSHMDAVEVFAEIKRLSEAGHRLWYDEGIVPSKEWPDDLAAALSGCSVFLVFLSPRAVQSRNVRNEIHFALERGKRILAVYLVETVLPGGLELRLGEIQTVRKYKLSQERYQRLLERALQAKS